MKRNPLIRFIPARLALLVAPLLAAWPQQSRAADGAFNGATAATWHAVAGWTPNTAFPGEAAATVTGEGLTTDIASAVAANAAANIGINFNTMGGQLTLGAIDWNKTNTTGTTIGNNSTTVSGILQLNGATVNSVANTILRCNNEANLAISNVNTGTAAVTMGVRLGTANGNIFVGQNTAATPALRTLTINSAITEATAGNGFTKTGTGVLTLTAANATSGLITVSDGSVRLQNATAAGTSNILLSNGDGAAVNNNDVLITGGLTYANNITLENTTNQNSRTRLQSTNTVNANANTWGGNVTFKGPGQNQTLLADTAPLIISGNLLQDATPSPSVFVRGVNAGTINGNITLGAGVLFKTDTGTWTISSTGNTMGNVLCADGLLIVNNNDALGVTSLIQMGQGSPTTGRLQINSGFTQQSTGLFTVTGSTSPTGHTIFGPGSLDFGVIARDINVLDNTATFNDLTINAPIAGVGGFNKIGGGNVIVNSAVTGPVNVNVGGLGGTGTLSGGVTVNGGAVLGGASVTTPGTLTVAGATLSAGSNLAMNLGSGGNDFIANSGALTSAGTAINVVPNGSFTTGQDIPIIGYTGVSPTTAPFTIALPLGSLGSRATASLVDLGAPLGIGIHIDSADKIIWTGGSDVWDIATTSNWRLQSDNVTPTQFQQFDALVFDDGEPNTSITLTGAATPVRAEFTNTTATTYSIKGTGGMGSTMVLDKTGDGTVTLNTANTYTGATNVSSGLLIGNFNAGTAVTAIPVASPVNVTGSGTVRFISDNLATNVAHVISGNGTVEHNARAVAGAVTALASNFNGVSPNFSGTLRLLTPNGGTQRLTQVPATALGTATIDVQSGHQLYTAPGQTYSNAITISGTGFQDANGNLGALRLDPGANWAGPITVDAGGARICCHNGTATIGGNITGGPLEVNVSNYNLAYTIISTGTNSHTTTTIGGGATQTTANISMRMNIGNGGTTGSLGDGAVFLNGDTTGTNGTNGILGFDRSDGFTLKAGNTITGGGTNLARTFIDFDTLGTGFAQNGVPITLGSAVIGSGGNLRLAVARNASITTFDGDVTAAVMNVGSARPGTLHLNSGANVNVANLTVGAAALATGSVLNINAGSSLTATGPDVGIGNAAGASTTVNHSGGTFTVGTVGAAARFRLGHFGNETSNYELTGGTLDLLGPAPATTPSITGNPEVSGGVCVGVDGTGIFNHSGSAIVNAHFVLLDTRGAATANATAGEDQYNHNGGRLNLTSNWGIIARHPSSSRFTLNGGTVDNAAPSGTAVMIDAPLTVGASGGTLDTSGASGSFVLTGSVTGAGNAVNTTGGGELTLEPNSKTVLDGVSDGLGTTTIEVNLTGDASVEKIGTGTTTLSGANTYSGGTTVTAGTLVVNGSVTGNGTVATGGTLAGNGTLGAVTAASGSVVSPGLSVGALAFGSLDLQAGSRYDVEITGAATNDKVNVTGALTANGTIKVTLAGYAPVLGDMFDIADGSIAGAPIFDFSAAVLTAGLAWDTSTFTGNGKISVIQLDPYIAWAAGFGLTEGKQGDDDKDGISNHLEFATNSNPTNGLSGARAYGKLHPLGGDNVLTLTVAVRRSALFAALGTKLQAMLDYVDYVIEASDDLNNWGNIAVTELDAIDGDAVRATLPLPTLDADWEWHTFRAAGGTSVSPRQMIRLSIDGARRR